MPLDFPNNSEQQVSVSSVVPNSSLPAASDDVPKAVREAKEAAANLTEQNKLLALQLKRMEEVEARMILGGRSEAGSTAPKELTKEELALKGAKELAGKLGIRIKAYEK